VSGELHSSAALPAGIEPWYPLDRMVGGPQSRSGRSGEEKNSQPPRRGAFAFSKVVNFLNLFIYDKINK
jgi:hypothetical protein